MKERKKEKKRKWKDIPFIEKNCVFFLFLKVERLAREKIIDKGKIKKVVEAVEVRLRDARKSESSALLKTIWPPQHYKSSEQRHPMLKNSLITNKKLFNILTAIYSAEEKWCFMFL